MAGSDGVARLAPLNHEPSQAQVESPFADVLAAVAVEAVRPDDRPDVLLERRPMRRQGSRSRRGTRKKRRDYKERRGRSAVDAARQPPPLPRLATIHPSLCISGLSGPPRGHASPAFDRAVCADFGGRTANCLGRVCFGNSHVRNVCRALGSAVRWQPAEVVLSKWADLTDLCCLGTLGRANFVTLQATGLLP